MTFNLYGSSLGFPVVSCHPIELETLLIPGGGIIIPIPTVDDLAERESHTQHSDNRGDWRDAVGHHRGAAAAIVLDAHRYGGSTRPVDLGQLMDLLRNAGYCVEAVNARLFKVDGKSATMADLVERAQRIDADAVHVAEAA
ncbi:hypothetical protein [Aliihoeflea sp. 2WW]|uniref:hypothetical protein n=1 Tax=Aliihoeflea sp. 2WW TaxID=1381123 RepID=UPI000557C5D4|nr:hypothetical protein [Aliihoeflea sp. 2WW]